MSSTGDTWGRQKRFFLFLIAAVWLIAAIWLLVPVLAAADEDLSHQAMTGLHLTAEGAAALEARLAEDPDDLLAHAQLATYSMRQQSDEGREARARHALWIIRHHPESTVAGNPACQLDDVLDDKAFDQGRDLWLEHVETRGDEPQVLGNAAGFLLHTDRELAAELLSRAKELDPANPEWSRRLGRLHKLSLMGQSGDAAKKTAASALRELEDSLAKSDADSRWPQLADLAKAAFAASELDQAESFAHELLAGAAGRESDWNYGNAIHHGNLILGRSALATGDALLAAEHLLAAGKTPGSPQLDSFGPNMSLAKEMLEAGERDAVLDYFELCAAFWKMDRGRLEDWAATVADGGIPIFGANLAY